MFIEIVIMERIEKRNGYVYLVDGKKGFETHFKLGKDPDDPMWKEEIKEIKKPKKKTKTQNSEK